MAYNNPRWPGQHGICHGTRHSGHVHRDWACVAKAGQIERMMLMLGADRRNYLVPVPGAAAEHVQVANPQATLPAARLGATQQRAGNQRRAEGQGRTGQHAQRD